MFGMIQGLWQDYLATKHSYWLLSTQLIYPSKPSSLSRRLTVVRKPLLLFGSAGCRSAEWKSVKYAVGFSKAKRTLEI